LLPITFSLLSHLLLISFSLASHLCSHALLFPNLYRYINGKNNAITLIIESPIRGATIYKSTTKILNNNKKVYLSFVVVLVNNSKRQNFSVYKMPSNNDKLEKSNF
jgi:hypothetical protein